MKLPRMIRNLWIYRGVVALALVVAVTVSFVFSNREEIDVRFPLLGTIRSWAGVVMLASAALGSAATWLAMTFHASLREARRRRVELERFQDGPGGESARPGSGQDGVDPPLDRSIGARPRGLP